MGHKSAAVSRRCLSSFAANPERYRTDLDSAGCSLRVTFALPPDAEAGERCDADE
jgi:hypothetical protein